MAKDRVTWRDLVAIARRTGVTVVEAPSSWRGKRGSMGTVVGVTLHHTGTPNSFRPELEYPDFNVVKEGRPGLENTLSAWGLGRHSTIYVFSEFLCWHAGEWQWSGITDGNGHFLGIEAAGVGDWTPFQRAAYPRLVASALLFLGEGIGMAPRHLDGAMPRGRKTDAANFDQQFLSGKNFAQSVHWLMANPAYININYKGDDVVAEEEDMDKYFALVTIDRRVFAVNYFRCEATLVNPARLNYMRSRGIVDEGTPQGAGIISGLVDPSDGKVWGIDKQV